MSVMLPAALSLFLKMKSLNVFAPLICLTQYIHISQVTLHQNDFICLTKYIHILQVTLHQNDFTYLRKYIHILQVTLHQNDYLFNTIYTCLTLYTYITSNTASE